MMYVEPYILYDTVQDLRWSGRYVGTSISKTAYSSEGIVLIDIYSEDTTRSNSVSFTSPVICHLGLQYHHTGLPCSENEVARLPVFYMPTGRWNTIFSFLHIAFVATPNTPIAWCKFLVISLDDLDNGVRLQHATRIENRIAYGSVA